MSDLISRQAAIKAICEDGTMFERQGKYTMTMAERKQKDADILDSLPSAQQVPWDRKTRNSMAGTLQMLRRLAYNIHGVMDVIDDDNVKRLTKWLEGGQE